MEINGELVIDNAKFRRVQNRANFTVIQFGKMRYKKEHEIAEVVRTFEDATISRDAWKHAEHLTVKFARLWTLWNLALSISNSPLISKYRVSLLKPIYNWECRIDNFDLLISHLHDLTKISPSRRGNDKLTSFPLTSMSNCLVCSRHEPSAGKFGIE